MHYLQMKYEQLAVRFKSSDMAEKFKEVFEKCQQDLGNEQKGSL